MKKMVLVILLSMPAFGMQRELQEAVRNRDVQKVSVLIRQAKEQPAQPVRSRLVPEKVDLNQIHELAQTLLAEHEQTSQSLNNGQVYKRVAISVGTILSSWVPLGICTYNGFTTGSWPSGEIVFGAITAALAGSYHGMDQLQLGLSNTDAKTNHAKHVAISHLTHTAKEESESQESA